MDGAFPPHVSWWSCLVASVLSTGDETANTSGWVTLFESRISSCISLAKTPFIFTRWRFRHFLLRLKPFWRSPRSPAPHQITPSISPAIKHTCLAVDGPDFLHPKNPELRSFELPALPPTPTQPQHHFRPSVWFPSPSPSLPYAFPFFGLRNFASHWARLHRRRLVPLPCL